MCLPPTLFPNVESCNVLEAPSTVHTQQTYLIRFPYFRVAHKPSWKLITHQFDSLITLHDKHLMLQSKADT